MSTYPVTSVKVTFDVVETLVERGDAGVTEVAEALDVPKSTAHDHLRTLERVGYVVSDDGRYRPSTKFLHVGEMARNDHELYVSGREAVRALYDATEDKYVLLVTEENGRCAVLSALGWERGTQSPQRPSTHPSHLHLHSNAAGKAILAETNPDAVDGLLPDDRLPARTAATTTDRGRLREELETVRDRGYAGDEGELIAGMTGLATAVVADGGPQGAVAVYGPSGAFPDDLADSDLPETVREAARTVEANLIFTPE